MLKARCNEACVRVARPLRLERVARLVNKLSIQEACWQPFFLSIDPIVSLQCLKAAYCSHTQVQFFAGANTNRYITEAQQQHKDSTL